MKAPTETARTEDLVVARRILDAGADVIGLVPANDVALTPVMLRLARALQLLEGGDIAIFPAPALSDGTDDRAGGHVVHDRGDGVFEVALPTRENPVRAGQRLIEALSDVRARTPRALLDLGGYLPDAREVLDACEGIVSVAVAGRTRDTELVALVETLPSARHLGTLLLER